MEHPKEFVGIHLGNLELGRDGRSFLLQQARIGVQTRLPLIVAHVNKRSVKPFTINLY